MLLRLIQFLICVFDAHPYSLKSGTKDKKEDTKTAESERIIC